MSELKRSRFERGEALVEMVILIPTLMLFVTVAIPLMTMALFTPWLDERLVIRHMLKDDKQVHPLLLNTHASDGIPSYFDRTDLKETSMDAPQHSGSLITFPGHVTRKSTVFRIQGGTYPFLSSPGERKRVSLSISRSLVKVKGTTLEERFVAEKVRRISILGPLDPVLGALEKIGLDLFHLNLNALPQSGDEEPAG